MLALKRRPGESLVLTFPDKFGLVAIQITIFNGGKIGVDAPDEAEILRAELLEY